MTMKTARKMTVTQSQLRDMDLDCLSQVVAILKAEGFTCNIHNCDGKLMLAKNTLDCAELYRAAKSTGHDWVTFHRGDAVECEGGVYIDWDSQGPTIGEVDAPYHLYDAMCDSMFDICPKLLKRWLRLNCR
jgi:hypothetical protein